MGRGNIFLVGMMGAGKTTLGKALAQRLRREFVDTDRVLVERTGVPVATIFEIEGEEGFRRREALALAELAQRSDCVIATGGGIVLAPENRQAMRASGTVVYLRARLESLWERTRHDTSRPLLATPDPRGTLAAPARGARAAVPRRRAPGGGDRLAERRNPAEPGRGGAAQPRVGEQHAMSAGELRVELGERAYPIHIGAGPHRSRGALRALRERPPRGDRHQRDRRAALRRARRGRAAAGRGDDPAHRAARRRSLQDLADAGSRSSTRCCARKPTARRSSSRWAAASSATWRDSPRRPTSAASRTCRFRPRCSRRSTPRSAARPRSTIRSARTWSAHSTSPAR